jgi:hypothetical protein
MTAGELIAGAMQAVPLLTLEEQSELQQSADFYVYEIDPLGRSSFDPTLQEAKTYFKRMGHAHFKNPNSFVERSREMASLLLKGMARDVWGDPGMCQTMQEVSALEYKLSQERIEPRALAQAYREGVVSRPSVARIVASLTISNSYDAFFVLADLPPNALTSLEQLQLTWVLSRMDISTWSILEYMFPDRPFSATALGQLQKYLSGEEGLDSRSSIVKAKQAIYGLLRSQSENNPLPPDHYNQITSSIPPFEKVCNMGACPRKESLVSDYEHTLYSYRFPEEMPFAALAIADLIFELNPEKGLTAFEYVILTEPNINRLEMMTAYLMQKTKDVAAQLKALQKREI